jgi:hypothetical protein
MLDRIDEILLPDANSTPADACSQPVALTGHGAGGVAPDSPIFGGGRRVNQLAGWVGQVPTTLSQ